MLWCHGMTVEPGLVCIEVGLVQIAHNAAKVILQQSVKVERPPLGTADSCSV